MDETIIKENTRYWTDYWFQATKTNKNFGTMQAKFWDKISSRFVRNQTPEKENERVKAMLDLVTSTGIDINGAEVLDIGAGTGSLSIPLAERGAKVTVIDFSIEMLKKLQKNADEKNVSINRIIHKSWDEIDLDAEGLREKYDLVIASMTPAVRDPQTFDLMMDASKKVCYYSGWVNRKWDAAYYDLHRMLFNTEYQEGVHGIYLPFMYLYLQGYHPKIVISENKWKNEETIDEMVEIISGFFNITNGIEQETKTKMREYLVQNGKDGKYYEEAVSISAMMVWDKQEKK